MATLRSLGVLVDTETNSVKYQRRWIKGMSHPAPLLPLRAFSAPHDYDIQAVKPHHLVYVCTTSDQNPQDTDTWHLVPATVH